MRGMSVANAPRNPLWNLQAAGLVARGKTLVQLSARERFLGGHI